MTEIGSSLEHRALTDREYAALSRGAALSVQSTLCPECLGDGATASFQDTDQCCPTCLNRGEVVIEVEK